jgi:hypothetical protein
MKLRFLVSLPVIFLFAAATAQSVQSNPADKSDCATVQLPPPGPDLPTRVEMLLTRETEELTNFRSKLAPEIRCEQSDPNVRMTCHDMREKLRDEAKDAQKKIYRYRATPAAQRKPAELYDIYDLLSFMLHDIEIFNIEDEYTGQANKATLAQAYNSFIKLTGVWFSGEIRNTIASLTPPK